MKIVFEDKKEILSIVQRTIPEASGIQFDLPVEAPLSEDTTPQERALNAIAARNAGHPQIRDDFDQAGAELQAARRQLKQLSSQLQYEKNLKDSAHTALAKLEQAASATQATLRGACSLLGEVAEIDDANDFIPDRLRREITELLSDEQASDGS